MSRLYVPASLDLLADLHATGDLVVTDDAVTAADETEEAEYDALMEAATRSADLLEGPGRRVVVVVEADADPAPGDRVALRQVAAVHADLEDRPEGADPEEDLAWFATQELPDLL